MAKRSGGDSATREIVREALNADVDLPEDREVEPTETPEAEVPETPDTTETPETSETPDAPEGETTDTNGDITSEAPAVEVVAESPEETEEPVATTEIQEPIETPVSQAPDVEPKVDVVTAFARAAEQLTVALARNPDAFSSGELAIAARAERNVDLALVDAGCDTTVGGHVARTFETRSKAIREALGETITVEAVRSLQRNADLGTQLFAELVKDTVAERTRAQGDKFDSEKYRDYLLATRDISFVKTEFESYRESKTERFTPGRQTVAPQPPDTRTTKEERKSLPVRPAESKAQSNMAAGGLILQPRTKI